MTWSSSNSSDDVVFIEDEKFDLPGCLESFLSDVYKVAELIAFDRFDLEFTPSIGVARGAGQDIWWSNLPPEGSRRRSFRRRR